MEAQRAHIEAAAAVCPLVLAIGQSSFAQTLIETLRTVADVGHCMVFAFDDERSARWAMSVGNISIGPDLGVAYSEHFHMADPNRDAIFKAPSHLRPITLPSFSRRMYDRSYRKLFFENSEIVDKVASAIWVGRACYYVNFYRTAAQGGFCDDERLRLTTVAPLVSAAVARHCQADAASADPALRLEALFASREPLVSLTSREKDVCLRILSGYSSEAIAADLGIGLNSAFTYRKRAYQKLGIASQNELFGIALRLMANAPVLN